MLRNLLWNQFSFPEKIAFPPQTLTKRFPVKSWKIYGHIFSKGFVRCYLEDIKWTQQQNFSDLFTIIGRRFFHLSLLGWFIDTLRQRKNHENQIFWPRDEKNFWTSQQEAKTWSKFGLVRKKFFFVKNRLIFNFLCLGIFSNANRLVPKHMFRFQCLFGLSSSFTERRTTKKFRK